MSCSVSTSSSSDTEGLIKISVKNLNSGSTVLGKGASALTITITEARLVIEKIEFESSLGDSFDFKIKEPFVQNLLADTLHHEIGSVQVPYGSYKELEIEIDGLTPDDGDVYTQNPELQGKSILVKGFFNGD